MKPVRILLGAALALAFQIPAVPAPAIPFEPLGPAPVIEAAPEPAQASFVRGVKALNAGRLDEAERAFREARKVAPGMVGPLLGLAEVAFKRNDVPGAGTFVLQAVRMAPNNGEAQLAWGRFLYTQGRYPEAAAAFERAIRAEPDLPATRIDLGDVYMNALDDPAKAAEAYRGALKIDPKLAGAHYALGVALTRLKQAKEARAELAEAARLEPDSPLPRYALGRLAASEGDLDRAATEFGQAIQAAKEYVPAYLALADVYVARDKADRALATYADAAKAAPADANVPLRTGMLQERLGRDGEARKSYLEAVRLDPKSPLAYNNLAWLEAARRGDLDQALKWAEEAAALAPGSASVLDTLGWVLQVRGEHPRAAETLQRADALAPGQPEIAYHLGVVESALGRDAQARTHFEQALAGKADFPGADDARKRLKALPGR